jgi:hypothetical protein
VKVLFRDAGRWCTVATALAASVMVSCAGGEATSSAGPTSGTTDTHQPTLAPGDLVARLADAGSFSPVAEMMGDGVGESSSVFVEHQGVAECLRAKGWAWEGPVVDTRPRQPRQPAALVEWARQYGYGLLNADPGRTTGSPLRSINERNQSMKESLPPEKRKRLDADVGVGLDNETGLPPSGCNGQVEEQVRKRYPGRNPAIVREVSALSREIPARAEYLEAQQRWAACMAPRGYTFASSVEARREFNDAFAGPAPSEELQAKEREVATADAECSIDTIWPVQVRLETEVVQKVIAKYGTEATCGSKCK